MKKPKPQSETTVRQLHHMCELARQRAKTPTPDRRATRDQLQGMIHELKELKIPLLAKNPKPLTAVSPHASQDQHQIDHEIHRLQRLIERGFYRHEQEQQP